MQTQVGDKVPNITLRDPDGDPVELASLLNRPTVVIIVRYYGCMPCQAYLKDTSKLLTEFTNAGVNVIGVGGAADYQATHLINNGVAFPLLLDPNHELYDALNLTHIHWWMMLSPETWWRYIKSAFKARQGKITGHPLQAPGLAILGQDGTVNYLHRGHTLGHYPPITDVLAAVTK